MSTVVEEHNALSSRLPLLLSVVEGMLEVGSSRLAELHIKKVAFAVKEEVEAQEKAQGFIDTIIEQQNFIKAVSLDCEAWRAASLRPGRLRQIEKLDSYLRDLTEMHACLLKRVKSFARPLEC